VFRGCTCIAALNSHDSPTRSSFPVLPFGLRSAGVCMHRLSHSILPLLALFLSFQTALARFTPSIQNVCRSFLSLTILTGTSDKSFYFNYDPPGVVPPVLVTGMSLGHLRTSAISLPIHPSEQCQTINITWGRGIGTGCVSPHLLCYFDSISCRPSAVAPYYLRVYTSSVPAIPSCSAES
jgi:hypothetical protein